MVIIHWPIAVYLILERKKKLSSVKAARARLKGIMISVRRFNHMSVQDIEWMQEEKWDDMDLSCIGQQLADSWITFLEPVLTIQGL